MGENAVEAPADLTKIGGRRFALAVITVAAVLTFVVAAQEFLGGAPMTSSDRWRWVAIGALDWFGWAALSPVVLLAARRWRLDNAGDRVRTIAVWAGVWVVLCLTQSLVTGMIAFGFDLSPSQLGLGPSRNLGDFLAIWTMMRMALNTIIFVLVVALVHAAVYSQEMAARRASQNQLQLRLAQAELNVLRMQLQPHFFFNALHTISSLMITDVATAQSAIASLGEIVRASIDHTARQEVELRDELSFVDQYVGIQKARFRNRLSVEVCVPLDLHEVMVPSLVLQPLVENAVRHGIERRREGGKISIAAGEREGFLVVAVRNDGPDGDSPVVFYTKRSARHRGRPSHGVGLANIEARLAQLYDGKARFKAGTTEDGDFEVELRIPLRRAPADGNGQASPRVTI